MVSLAANSLGDLGKMDNQDDNIILTGFMGTGKTTVGKLLAKVLAFKFVDTDE